MTVKQQTRTSTSTNRKYAKRIRIKVGKMVGMAVKLASNGLWKCRVWKMLSDQDVLKRNPTADTWLYPEDILTSIDISRRLYEEIAKDGCAITNITMPYVDIDDGDDRFTNPKTKGWEELNEDVVATDTGNDNADE